MNTDLFRLTWGHATRLRIYRELKTYSREVVDRTLLIAGDLSTGPWVEAVNRVTAAFWDGGTPIPYDVVAVAMALESRMHLEAILFATEDLDLSIAVLRSDEQLKLAGPSLHFLTDNTYRVALNGGKPPAGTWCTWRDDVNHKVWMEDPLGYA